MDRAVALLRAVNVGGRTASRAQLTAALEGVGLTGVSTFLASGNVLLDQPYDPVTGPRSDEQRAALELRIEAGLLSVLGFPAAVFVRTSAELGALAAYDAFPAADPSVAQQVAFLRTVPAAQARAAVAALSTDRDTLVVADHEVWWLARDGVGRSALTPGALDRAVGQPVTVRSRTTVRRLAALLQG